jgi:hypothetical protein
MTSSENSGRDEENKRLLEEVSELRRKACNQEEKLVQYRQLSEQLFEGDGMQELIRVWLKDARQQSDELRFLFEQV